MSLICSYYCFIYFFLSLHHSIIVVFHSLIFFQPSFFSSFILSIIYFEFIYSLNHLHSFHFIYPFKSFICLISFIPYYLFTHVLFNLINRFDPFIFISVIPFHSFSFIHSFSSLHDFILFLVSVFLLYFCLFVFFYFSYSFCVLFFDLFKFCFCKFISGLSLLFYISYRICMKRKKHDLQNGSRKGRKDNNRK